MNLLLTRRQQLWVARVLWSLIAVKIGVRGMQWMLADAQIHAWLIVLLPVAASLGALKGFTAIRRFSARVVARLQTLAERTPVWQVYSPGVWLLIAGMIGLGVLCRWAGVRWQATGVVGVLNLMVCVALAIGSLPYWRGEAQRTLSGEGATRVAELGASSQ